jgi:predicted PurR-regulated permease PerM
MAYIVPYLGTAIGLIAASIMSLLQHGLDWHIFAAWLVFGVVQALEGSIITPRVVGNKVGLSPVAVIAAILIAGDLLGFLGVLIAVPTAAVLNVFIKDALERYKQSRFFLEPPAIKIFSADFEVAPPKETQPAALEKTEEADE